MVDLIVAFAVGLAIGAVVSWLAVSWFYYEALRARGLIDYRGRWVKGGSDG
jgi:hypothetical protein